MNHKFDLIIIKFKDLSDNENNDIHSLINKINLWGSIAIITENNEEYFLIENKLKDLIDITSFKINITDQKNLILIFNGTQKISFLNDVTDKYFKFLKARQLKPSKIGLAFLGKNNYENEKIILKDCVKNNFVYETWFRNEIWSGTYNSFSQIINESVFCMHDSEFIFWIHPRVNTTFEIIENLLVLLCSGYAFVSEVNFGLFGCSKQLFRKIGLMDERFIGGECEDLDWFFRLKMNNISFFERGNESICLPRVSSWGIFRGLSHTQFEEKWLRVGENQNYNSYTETDWTLSKDCETEKKLIDYKSRPDIEKTWLNCDHSFGKTWLADNAVKISFVKNEYLESEEFVNSTFLINVEENYIRFEFLCEKNLFIMATVHNKNGVVISGCRIKNNSFYMVPSSPLKENELYELRINFGQYRLTQFFVNKIPFNLKMDNFAIKIKNKKLKNF